MLGFSARQATKTGLPTLLGNPIIRSFKSELKIKWVRPEKISCTKPEKSGDRSKLAEVDKSQLMMGYDQVEELKKADEVVKSLFTYQNNPRKHGIHLIKANTISEVQRHPLDFGSMESLIAHQTVQIRSLQESFEKSPHNKVVKVQLKELIDRRKRFLRYLRRWDYRRFEWLLEKLDLVYKPYPAKFHWITRKESLQKLTTKYCEDLKEERLNEYKKILESQQIPFLEEKLKNLEFIKSEQLACQVQLTVSEEDIKDVKTKLENLKMKKLEEEEAAKKQKSKEDIFDLSF